MSISVQATTESNARESPTCRTPPAVLARVPAVRSLRRLYPYARPALPALIGSAITATLAMLCGLAFPLVIQQIIDGPVAAHDRAALWPLAGLLLALGVAESGLFWIAACCPRGPS
jgi:ATP-binding cassette, subfamily B, bacterial